MPYVIRAHMGGHYTDTSSVALPAGTDMYTFALAHEAANQLQKMADAILQWRNSTVTGAGFTRWATVEGQHITYRIHHI